MEDQYVMSRRDMDYVRWKHKAQSSRQLVIIAVIFFTATLIGIVVFGLIISGVVSGADTQENRLWTKDASGNSADGQGAESWTYTDGRGVTVTLRDGLITGLIPRANADNVIAANTHYHAHTVQKYMVPGDDELSGTPESHPVPLEVTWEATAEDDSITFHPTDGRSVSSGTDVSVSHRAMANGDLRMVYTTETSEGAVMVNMTNTVCLNLAGKSNASDVNHKVNTFADYHWSESENTFKDVVGSTNDFRTPKVVSVGESQDLGLFILRGPTGKRPAARVHHAGTGHTVTVYTDQPCVHLYTTGGVQDKLNGDTVRSVQQSLCVETRGYPQSDNDPLMPPSLLVAGSSFIHTTWMRLDLQD